MEEEYVAAVTPEERLVLDGFAVRKAAADEVLQTALNQADGEAQRRNWELHQLWTRLAEKYNLDLRKNRYSHSEGVIYMEKEPE